MMLCALRAVFPIARPEDLLTMDLGRSWDDRGQAECSGILQFPSPGAEKMQNNPALSKWQDHYFSQFEIII